MSWITRNLKQKSLYWDPPTRDGYGAYVWGFPEEIDTRWRASGRAVRYDKRGAEIISEVIVWTTYKYIIAGGYIMKGTLYDIGDLAAPPVSEPVVVDSLGFNQTAEFARQILDVASIESLIDSTDPLVKLWLK